MRLGIIGLEGSGKTTVFEALTRTAAEGSHKGENRIGTVKVPDLRIDALSNMFRPQKTTYAQVEYLLPGKESAAREKSRDPVGLIPVRDCDALIHVVRNFSGYGLTPPQPKADFGAMDQELILSDLVVVEKRLERLELDAKRGKKIDSEECSLLRKCREALEREEPLRNDPEIASAPVLKGYMFLSAKPMLVLFNNDDEDPSLPPEAEWVSGGNVMVIRAKIEHELSRMSGEEAEEFLSEFDIAASALDRVIGKSYELLCLISFFTVGEDEVRAWTIRKGTVAVDAAGAVHTDIKKGFIRGEVVSYADLMDAGSLAEARKRGTLRLEGKTYEVKDGDIVHFRFNI